MTGAGTIERRGAAFAQAAALFVAALRARPAAPVNPPFPPTLSPRKGGAQ